MAFIRLEEYYRLDGAELPRVLFLNHTGQLGGAEHALANLLDGLGLHAEVFLLEDGPFREVLERRGIRVRIAPVSLYRIKKKSGLSDILSLPAVLKAAWQVVAHTRSFDLICTNSTKSSIVGILAGWLSGTSVVVFLHDILSDEHFSKVHQRLVTLLTNCGAAKVVANSQATGRAYVLAGGDSAKLTVLYPALNVQEFEKLDHVESRRLRADLGVPEEAFVIGCFSRVTFWKGHEVLFRAIAELDKTAVVLVCGAPLFGEEDWYEKLQELVRNLEVEDRVRFLGFRDDVKSVMRSCDLIVSPSLAAEPFGMSIVEAQLSKRCVIATDAGGAREIIDDGRSGLLVPSGDPQALRSAIIRCMQDPQTLSRIGEDAHNSALRFNKMHAQSEFKKILYQVRPAR